MMKIVYFILGWFFFVLGIIGVLLPVVPTTPFMLLALWAFSRSSDRFHSWLYNHSLFGPPLQMWQKHRVIPLAGKIMSVSFISISFIYMTVFSPVSILLKLIIAVFMLYGVWFVLTKPSVPPKNDRVIEL